MSQEVKLEQFTGPLDLLLQLIEQDQLNITEISLTRVTEQFFAYLDTLGASRPDELADFLVIATKLVYLKSKQLLPALQPEVGEGPSLADQLKMYARYREASKFIEELWNRGTVAYGRIEPRIVSTEFVLPNNAVAGELTKAMVWLLNRLKPVNPLPEVSIDRTISVRQKVESIFNSLKQLGKLTFSKLLGRAENRTDLIVSFLALLELVKHGRVSIEQSDSFSEMEIKKI